jgi:hypothetical protein
METDVYRLEQIGPEQFVLARVPKVDRPEVRSGGIAAHTRQISLLFGANLFTVPTAEHMLGHAPGLVVGALASAVITAPVRAVWNRQLLRRAIRRHQRQVGAGDVILIPAAVYELYRHEYELAGIQGFETAMADDPGLILELIELNNDIQKVPSGGAQSQALRQKLENRMQQSVRAIAEYERDLQIAAITAKYSDE